MIGETRANLTHIIYEKNIYVENFIQLEIATKKKLLQF